MSRLVGRAVVCTVGVLLSACAVTPKFGVKDKSKSFNTVVVDAGHGGKDTGAYRRYGGAEKYATLDVARRLDRKLRESELKTVMTRSAAGFLSVVQRAAIENGGRNS